MPETADAIAVMSSVEAAVQSGFAGPQVDVAGALALAQARGVSPHIAAELIGPAVEGIMLGTADRKGGGKDDG